MTSARSPRKKSRTTCPRRTEPTMARDPREREGGRVMPGTTNDREFPWHDRLERRSFLKGAAGTVAAVVVGTALQYDAVAQRVSALQGRRFFSAVDAETIGAIAERIWPETD